MKTKYNLAPGRGMMNQTAFDLRMDYVKSLVDDIEPVLQSESIALSKVQNNIESFIGTVEIPLGLIGPLLYSQKGEESEWVHTAVATTEGALVASMNRGAKAISQCGGFKAHVIHQKMLRAPTFAFASLDESLAFNSWIESKYDTIKKVTKEHSNHADLIEIKKVVVGKVVHLKFIYSTCDASGQNMTTSCTWQACLWIQDQFQLETDIEIETFVLDGNGSSDKKVSYYSMQNGRGTSVISECLLTNEVIENTLRTTAEDMARSFNYSMAISKIDGMIGYNINVANAIAGIFASTGQDLACIHESSVAIFQMEKTEEGLYTSLSLPSLVIGTVGGGTHLPVSSKVLELMDCKGNGKAARFAKLIAGFALSLELSTHAAIASGQFARAHQKLGRNKPVKWFLKSELDVQFFNENLLDKSQVVKAINIHQDEKLDNGILTQLAAKASKKAIGFVQTDLQFENETQIPLLVKSKALGNEVIEGLHYMASNLSAQLADSILKHKHSLEYRNSHLTEIEIYKALSNIDYAFIPKYYGSKIDTEREMYLFFIERLNAKEMKLFNSQNDPSLWNQETILNCIKAIHQVHAEYVKNQFNSQIPSLTDFNALDSIELYQTFIHVNRKDYSYLNLDDHFDYLNEVLNKWRESGIQFVGQRTLIHNDFNPRNVAVRANGDACIYDWELATINVPQRDIFEFLSFTLEENFSEESFWSTLRFHHQLSQEINGETYSWKDYLQDFETGGEDFLLTRVCFYMAGSTLVNYSFIERVFKTSFLMINRLKKAPVE
ncbi:MAG: hydroxymethylglutaryl-CoA reductase (NADPH) [Parvicellaceae bacterium]|jgi:hydroxymethylglutaryl-CoA reductase (NADPH)